MQFKHYKCFPAWHGMAQHSVCNSKRSRAQNVRPIQNSQIYFCQLFNAFHYVFAPCVLCLLNTHRRTHTCTHKHRQSLNGPTGAKELLYSCSVCVDIAFFGVSLCIHTLSSILLIPFSTKCIQHWFAHTLLLCSLFIKRLTLIGYRKYTLHVKCVCLLW